ncbi:probable 6-phosphogluconolactonase 1 [Dendrobium catenatum]|uniref:Probable 6-phosphogluconolactonase n=1 Tax=Dendrobium catenatum TaxID=906689 RepID=A0A2I0W3E7_9ASPA|nr:probable 6-phosphogluconolactonase 1 [Dendrobium catenatum]PKU70180.1 putative 6-phosphogluconolactonase 1 [Dendrobium catenatum]
MAASGDVKSINELRIFESIDDLATDLAEYIAQLSEVSVRERGFFTIALTGGSLISLMGKLSEAPYNKTVDWTKWYVFWADERAVAKNHVDSNYKLTKDGFLSKVSVLNSHIYSINENLTVEEAAREYEFMIRQLVKVRTIDVSESNDCPKFDLILLELGSDGHVASLFPHHISLQHKEDWVTYITDSPEPPPERITFTLPVINSASNIVMLGVGDEKAMVVKQVIDNLTNGLDVSLPAKMVSPSEGKLVWFLDKPSASFLNAKESKQDEI